MMLDYSCFKTAALNAANAIGLYCSTPLHVEWLSAEQRSRMRGVNFMTQERWQYRLLADRSKLVEISYGRGIGGDHMIGLTVFHRDDKEADFKGSRAVFSVDELKRALEEIDGATVPCDCSDPTSCLSAEDRAACTDCGGSGKVPSL